jgi:hypothetical protein
MATTDWRRYPQMNERGLGPATSRQPWRLNREGLLALRKARGEPLANRLAARVISELDANEPARFECDREGRL